MSTYSHFAHLLIGLVLAAPAGAVTIIGTSNIFGSGYGDTPFPGGGGGGTLPLELMLPGGAMVVRFPSVTGTVTCCSDLMAMGNGPDGGLFASGTTDILPHRAIAGILHGGATMFLVGVFLGPVAPGPGPAPPRLDFSGGALSTSFLALMPGLNQPFFIGDGLTGTGSGSLQTFVIPVGATRLFLGFADAFEFGSPSSPPGFYGDNAGMLEATVEFASIPEPGTLLLSAMGLALAAFRVKRRVA